MKKYITLFTFICVLFLGMQTATAQDTPEIRAKMKTLELSKAVELSDAQVKQVYKLYLAYEKGYQEGERDALNTTRKAIIELLEPEQKQKFKASFAQEVDRKRKLERGNP